MRNVDVAEVLLNENILADLITATIVRNETYVGKDCNTGR